MTIRQSATQKLLLSDPFFYFPAGTQSKFNRYLDSDSKFLCGVVRPTFSLEGLTYIKDVKDFVKGLYIF